MRRWRDQAARVADIYQLQSAFHRAKTTQDLNIDVKTDDEAWLYFECHDVVDYDKPTRSIIADLFLAGTVKHIQSKWVFWDMTSGSGAELSPDHYYFSA